MKINANEIRVGMLLEYKDDLWQVLKTQHVKPGKGGAFAQVEMKSVNKNTKLNADGCHLGQKDKHIDEAKKIIGRKIIGITCHNSIKLAKTAIKSKASYIAFGAFFSTKTKKVKYRATVNILKRVKKLTKIPIVAIGGINNNNYKKLLLNNVNLLAISSYVWNNKKLKPLEAIKLLK